MRLAAVAFCAIATVLAITIKTIYGLFVMCGDFVYVMLFPQLVCVMFVSHFNTFGSIAGVLYLPQFSLCINSNLFVVFYVVVGLWLMFLKLLN